MVEIQRGAVVGVAKDDVLHLNSHIEVGRFRSVRATGLNVYDVAVFDRLAWLYDAVMPAADQGPLRSALETVDGPVETVLDIGGGSGRAATALGEGTVVLDASWGMLKRARDKGFAVVQGDAGRLPVGDEVADVVVIVDALHHFPDTPRTLDEVYRILRPGGVLVIREFDPGTIRGRLTQLGESALRFGSTFYGPDDLSAEVAAAGFDATVPSRGFSYTVLGERPEVDGTTGAVMHA
jgi:SAM-dependent methyltransferase